MIVSRGAKVANNNKRRREFRVLRLYARFILILANSNLERNRSLFLRSIYLTTSALREKSAREHGKTLLHEHYRKSREPGVKSSRFRGKEGAANETRHL